ncbi:reverse transcriptase domain-containing protein [Tanacetum coccineum]|uniref:Reverse transcriptase domain-containing protein n=1 Tax=Tanacetum coccineum TaxID=301880 RepID=A0ABQ4XXN2_9ASTR
MWESAKIVAPTPNSAIIQLDVDDNFVINSTHLNMIRENKFDGYLRANPHDHICEFLAICNMFRYGKTQSEAVKLMIFPYSLSDKAKIWFNELNEESITSWGQKRKAFITSWGQGTYYSNILSRSRRTHSRNPGLLFKLDSSTKSENEHHQKSIAFADGSNNDNSRLMEKLEALTIKIDSQFSNLKEELQDMRNKYNNLEDHHASKTRMNDDTLMCERHVAKYIQSRGSQNQNSNDLYSLQSHSEQTQSNNDSKKLLTELNNDVKNDLEDFKRRIHSMRTVHDKLFDRDDQSKTDLEKSITKFLDDQRVISMFVKNNINDMILKIKKNENNFQTKIKNMERKIDEWLKFQNVSLEQTDRTDPPPPQAHTEQVNAVFTERGKFDDSLKIQTLPPIIVNNKTEKDKPIKTSEKGYHVVKTKEYPFCEHIPKIPYPKCLRVDLPT